MGEKIAATCLHWSQSVVSQSPCSSHTLASAISSSSSKRGRQSDRALFRSLVNRSDRLALFGKTTTKFLRSRSCENFKSRDQTLRRAISANLDGFSSEEAAENIQELALSFRLSDDGNAFRSNSTDARFEILSDSRDKEEERRNSSNTSCKDNFTQFNHSIDFVRKIDSVEAPWLRIRSNPPDWPEIDEVPASIERKANSVDLPLSLRIIKRKKQWEEGFRETGGSAYCSMKKAFSSMVFIIREIQSYVLQMREILLYEDLQGIPVRVQKEMHASFVWLFQQIFSHTPNLMVYVMILLANFTVYSITNNTAIAVPLSTESYTAVATVWVTENQNQHQQPKFDCSAVKRVSVSFLDGKRASIGGNSGGGNARAVPSGTDGSDGPIDGSSSFDHHRTPSFGKTSINKEAGSGLESERLGVTREEETKLWNSIVEEASKMKAAFMDEALDHETMQRFVSPETVNIEPEDYSDYFRTELQYQFAVSQEPNNPLFLSNYAQFLYLVAHDHDRAEEYFKRAIEVRPADAEALSRYANFLWLARKDLSAAEETYLEAIEAEPGNMFYAGNYAHFLWNTGGEDTCYPLSPQNDESCETL